MEQLLSPLSDAPPTLTGTMVPLRRSNPKIRSHHYLSLDRAIYLMLLLSTSCDQMRPGDNRAEKTCDRLAQLAEDLCHEGDEEIVVACLQYGGGGRTLGDDYASLPTPACWTERSVCPAALDAGAEECKSHRGTVLAQDPNVDPDDKFVAQCCDDSGDDCEDVQWGCY